MKLLKNISESNIHSYIYRLASDLKNTKNIQSLTDVTQEINEYLISSEYNDFKLIKTQLTTTKTLYKNGVLSDLDYKKYKKFYNIANLKRKIDIYIKYFSSGYKDSEKLFFAIDTIKKACSNKLILDLSETYISRVNTLMNIMDSCIEKSSELQKSNLIHQLNKVKNKLSKDIAYNNLLQEQDIIINIKPISQDFSTEDISFHSSKHKEIFKQKSLALNNLHIQSLNIKEYIYGIDGTLTFQLAYPKNHKDFDFLLTPLQPLLIDIQINDSFNFFKKDSKKDYHKRSTRFMVIGNVIDHINIKEKYEYSIYSQDDEKVLSGVKKFKLKFHDPLKSLWKLHQPTYIDINKSLDDIFKDNFFFDNLITLNSNKSDKLKNRIAQVFVSTIGRNFYDFFIEQLYENKCFLKYFCDKKNGKVTYYITDNIDDSLKTNISNTDDDVTNKLSSYDLSCLKGQTLNSKKPGFRIKENCIIPDITLSTAKKKEKNSPDSSIKPFSSIYKDDIKPIFYHAHESLTEETESSGLKVKISSTNTLPFINSEICLEKLENQNNYILGSDVLKNFFINKRTFSLKRSKYSTKRLYDRLSSFHYKSDSESDVYEKISCCKFQSLTHRNEIIYSMKDYDKLYSEYPRFKSFESFNIIGKVTIGENVNKDSKKAYKFFKNYKSEESSFSEFQESGEKGASLILNSKPDILYSVEIAKEILNPKSSEKPIIYIPSKININSSNNQFIPLRNDDIIMIKALSMVKAEILEIISNSAISTEKGQKQQLQRQLMGAKENCEMAYNQANDDETFSLTQLNEANESSFLINNKKGIFLRYKSKGN
ncbi:pathogenicity determinant protein PdpA1 [Francisella uliginis]|uniref:Pathogenicity determinant protein PdpA1 n=1 Tax=Francisella uliginis TaxID=573570 RepID=A0A1L4BTH7_9GAMM|nr:pathogenicity determinant protein PdpA1 [Francisella uliginis]API87156.1 pathogenicity determinant protein PdpA1 [Francisella uliginis]